MARGSASDATVSVEAVIRTSEARNRELWEELGVVGRRGGQRFAEGVEQGVRTGAGRVSGAANALGNALNNTAIRSNSAVNNLRFGFQNLGFQIQDIVVGLEAGQAPLRVFIQQGSQILGAWGATGAIAGGIIITAAVIVAKFIEISNAAIEAGEKISTLDDILETFSGTAAEAAADMAKLVEQFHNADALGQGQILGKVQLDLEIAREEMRKTEENYLSLIDDLSSTGAGREAFATEREALQKLVEDFERGAIGADQFRTLLSEVADVRGGTALRDLGEDLITAQRGFRATQLEVERLQAQLDRLEIGRALGDIDVVAQRIAEAQEKAYEEERVALEKAEKARAEAAARAKKDQEEEAIRIHEIVAELDALNRAYGEVLAGRGERVPFEGKPIPVPPTGGKPPTPEEDQKEAARQAAQADAERLALNQQIASYAADYAVSLLEAVARADDLKEALIGVLINMGELIAKALIYRAVLSGLEAAGGGGGAEIKTEGARGLVYDRGQQIRFQRGGLIVNQPTSIPTALIGEAGAPEGVFPLTRTSTGRLGIEATGVGGGGTVINIDARGSAPGETAAALNTAFAVIPGATINSLSRSPAARRKAGIRPSF